jgi:hypothetical protein
MRATLPFWVRLPLTNAERRKTLRLELAMPVRVQGFEADGSSWNETSSTADVSARGASFPLARSVALGQVLLLVLPLPKRLRQYDANDASYRVYALVRGVQHKPDATRVGVMFFGKFPPRGFLDHPGARFLLPSDAQGAPSAPEQPAARKPTPVSAGPSPEATLPPPPAARAPSPPPVAPPTPAPPPQAFRVPVPDAPAVPGAPGGLERRQHPRYSLFVNFTLQQVDEFGAVLQEELTVADSLGKGGAEVMTTLDFGIGDVVLMQEAGGGFATRAEIRSVTRGADGVGRLHLKFLDRPAPDRILQR